MRIPIAAASLAVPGLGRPVVSAGIPGAFSGEGRRLGLSPVYPEAKVRYFGENALDHHWNLVRSIAVGDVNRDGALDIVLGIECRANELFINDGGGGFPVAPTATLPVSDPCTDEVIMGDFNNDGFVDIFTSGENPGNQELLLHDQTNNTVPYPTITFVTDVGRFPAGASHAVDINKDGNLDLVIAARRDHKSIVRLGDGKGNFPTLIELDDHLSYAQDVTAADLDGDGDLDILIGYQRYYTYPAGPIAYLNDGNRTNPHFTGLSLSDLPSSYAVATGDFNNDGRIDVATGDYGGGTKVLINNGTDASGTPTFITSGGSLGNYEYLRGIAVEDVNKDGHLDMALFYNGHTNDLLLNDQSGGFEVYELPDIQPANHHGSYGGQFADFNNDDWPDIVVGKHLMYEGNPEQHMVLINDGAGSSSPTSSPTKSPTGNPTDQPTTAQPTVSPTDGPTTSQPTGNPTDQPTTPQPTDSPTNQSTPAAPWSINFLGVDVDFTRSSDDELVLTYEIGKDREYETFLYTKDCSSNIMDVTVDSADVKVDKNATHDLLTLSHSIDKSAIANSSIWNNTSSKIQICQVVNLILPAADGLSKMVVVEDVREVDVDFQLSVDYSVANDLGAGTTEEAAAATDVTSYVLACKCEGPDFDCNSTALVPNTQLHVCVKSVSTDVEIDELMSMTVSQGASSLAVIEDGDVEISSIADVAYVRDENGVVVTTFVPTNLFNYSAGASVNVSGTIDMKLVGSARKLARLDGGAYKGDGNGKASYELKVDLQDEMIVVEDEGTWMGSSGPAITGKASSTLIGVAFLLAVAKW